MEFNHYVSLISWLALLYGFLRRENRVLHVQFMLTGIGIDSALCLYTWFGVYLPSSESIPPIELGYQLISSGVALLYLPVIYLGSKLLSQGYDPITKEYHIRFGYLALFFRQAQFALLLVLIYTYSR